MIDIRVDIGVPALTTVAAAAILFASVRTFAQGGDDPGTATLVPSLPYTDTGTTLGYADDSDENCGDEVSTSPDVYYLYLPTSDHFLSVDVCDSSFRTKVYVYDADLVPVVRVDGTPACNGRDLCLDLVCGPFGTAVECVPVRAGKRYFIVVDGRDGDAGPYEIRLDEDPTYHCNDCAPCPLECPEGGTHEGSDCRQAGHAQYVDRVNGGCDVDPPVFSSISCGKTICGTSFTNGEIRDTDWFVLDTSSDLLPSRFRFHARAGFPAVFGRIENEGGALDCSEITGFAGFEFGSETGCIGVRRLSPVLDPGLYWFYVAPEFTGVLDCRSTDPLEVDPRYTFRVDCDPISPTPTPTCEIDVIRGAEADSGALNDAFGIAAAISGELAIVGAYKDDEQGPQAGAAFVFRKLEGRWQREAKLLAPDGADDDGFGWTVAISGDTAVVGAPFNDGIGEDAGAAYVFREDGRAWTCEAILHAPGGSAFDAFGEVAIEGDVIVVGAPHVGDLGFRSGAVYVYRRADATWLPAGRITAPDAEAGDQFGDEVALRGDRAVIGASSDDDNGHSSGSAYVYRMDGHTIEFEAKLVPSDGRPDMRFGRRLAIDDTIVVAGVTKAVDPLGLNPGAAYVFRFDGSTWAQEAKILASDHASTNGFGRAVAVDDGDIVVGRRGFSLPGSDGAAYIYESRDGVWNERAKLLAADDVVGGRLGAAAAIDGDDVIIGAYGVTDSAPPGRAYVFDLAEPCRCVSAFYQVDDGEAETGFGIVGSTDLIWLNHFVVEPGKEIIDAIVIDWWESVSGSPTTLMVYDDPNDDGDPNDAVLLHSVETRSVSSSTPLFVPIHPVVVGRAGDSFFVGAAMTQDGAGNPIPSDTSSPDQGASWLAIAFGGSADIEELSANLVPPQQFDFGNWVLRAHAMITGGSCLPGAVANTGRAVDVDDLLAVLMAWGACVDCAEDVNGDARIDAYDVISVLAAWGERLQAGP